jgi:hypothetical protein
MDEHTKRIWRLREEVEMLKGCIDFINPTSDSVEKVIQNYKEYVASFEEVEPEGLE